MKLLYFSFSKKKQNQSLLVTESNLKMKFTLFIVVTGQMTKVKKNLFIMIKRN